MPAKKAMGREYLLRVISLCLSVSRRGVDPFEVEVKRILDAIGKYLPEWKLPEDFSLDAETLNWLSSVVELQAAWIKHMSSSLYVDPLLIELKLKALDAESLSGVFARSWRPIVELEQLVPRRVKEAVDYWNLLPPLEGRWPAFEARGPLGPGSATEEELRRRGMILDRSFEEALEEAWRELVKKAGEGRVPFWDFVYADSYGETVRRAYLASFLVTYGYAGLASDPLEGEYYLKPFKERGKAALSGQAVSVPISIDRDVWVRRKG